MMLSMYELANARECVSSILDQIPLDNYLFDIEPKEAYWQIELDCCMDGHWQSLKIEIDAERLRKCTVPGQAQQELLNDWKNRIIT